MNDIIPSNPPLPADLRGADDVVSIAEAYQRGWQDALHAAAEAIRAEAAEQQLRRDQEIGDERRKGEQP